MSKQEPPKNPRKPRTKGRTVNLSEKNSWENIVDAVEKKEVPVEVMDRVSVNLIDGTNITVDIKRLIREGEDPLDIEAMLNEKFQDLDEYIQNVDFFVDVDQVKNLVKSEMDKIFKDL